MSAIRDEIMQRLYAEDIWAGFHATNLDPQGWNGAHPSLARIAHLGGGVVVDVGVWKGQSTITMAASMKEAGLNACVIAVDTFLGSPEHWPMKLFERNHGIPDLYQRFMSNVVAAGLTDYIVPLPQTSVTAAHVLRSLGVKVSLAHIDAAHEYDEVLRDAEEYWSLLAPGGYLVGDDYDVNWPGVVKAAGVFSAKCVQPLTIEPPKWILQKPS